MDFIENLRTIEEILKNNSKDLKSTTSLFYVEKISSRISDIVSLAHKRGIKTSLVDKSEMQKYSQKRNAPVVLVLENNYFRNFLTVSKYIQDTKYDNTKKLVIVLDKIEDPQNLGNIFRTCELFKTDLLILPKRNSAKVNSTVKNVAVGGTEYVKYVSTSNLNGEIELLKEAGYWIYTSSMKGEKIYDVEFKEKVCLIIGNEQKGVSNLISSNSDFKVSIPTIGVLDSFNVASATAIMVYQIRKTQNVI